MIGQIAPVPNGCICMKELSVGVSQLNPFYGTSLSPVSFLLLKKVIKLCSEDVPKIPLSKSKVPVVF